MKPPKFDYRSPETVAEVIGLLAEFRDDASVLAGGQSLLPLLNMRLARPDVLVDLGRVQDLDTIDVQPDRIVVGAGVRLARLERDPDVRDALPVIAQAIGFVAHPQIRNRTTVGGTLCHADPAAELPCVAVALGAVLCLRSARGERRVEAADFFESVFMTARQPDELLVAVEFPRDPALRFVYDEVARRHGDFPFVGLCLGVQRDGSAITAARAAAAGVADRPLRLGALEAALTGASTAAGIEAAATAATDETDPPDDQHGTAAFRRSLLRRLVRTLAHDLMEVAA
ncbi:FAD binding domain-containing protein [Nocardioides sp. AN3]